MPPVPIPLLLVEDNPVYAEILQRLLPTLDPELRFAVTWVDSAEKALAAIGQTHFELLLLDYKLPGADGLSVLAHVRLLPLHQQPATIMLTGMGREDIAVEAMKNGARDYLSKDALDVPSLLRAITGALAHKRLEAQLARSNAELQERNTQLQADLNLAREIQLALLPHHYPCFPATADAATSTLRFCHQYQPTGIVGGDYFDVLQLSDDTAGIFLCDVMGHGVRAALITAVLRGLLEELKPIGADPGRMLTQFNRSLLSILKQTRTPIFASALYLVVDLPNAEIRYANAGHPSPFVIQADPRLVAWLNDPQNKPGPVLGVFGETDYVTSRRPLAARDRLLLYTDGLFEVPGPTDEMFGEDRLRAAVVARHEQPTSELIAGLLADIHNYAGQRGFLDDVCVVGVDTGAAKMP